MDPHTSFTAFLLTSLLATFQVDLFTFDWRCPDTTDIIESYILPMLSHVLCLLIFILLIYFVAGPLAQWHFAPPCYCSFAGSWRSDARHGSFVVASDEESQFVLEMAVTSLVRAQSCGLLLAKNSCAKRTLRPEQGASLKITLR